MTSSSFKETILKLLGATEYSFNVKSEQLSSFESQSNLKPFFDWFVLNVTPENCISHSELEQFKQLEENGDVLYGKELEEALQAYRNNPVHSLVPYSESFNENINDEVMHVKEQLSLKSSLLTILKSSTSKTTDDMCKLYNDLQKAEASHTKVLKENFALIKVLNTKLTEVKETLDELRERLSELDQNNEVSTDEGIDTLVQDKLNCSTWSMTSTMTVQSIASSDKISNGKYLCQLPFHKYDKQQRLFTRLVDGLMQKYLSKTGRVEEPDMEIDLELLNIMERLSLRKESYMISLGELEGLKAARDKIKDVYSEVQKGTWKFTELKLRNELGDFEEDSNSFEESLTGDVNDLNEACEKWAEFQTLKPVCDRLEKKIEYANSLLGQIDEITDALRLKVSADTILCEMLDFEVERVQTCVQMHNSVYGMIREMVETTKKRLDVMAVNLQDYLCHCASPIEEHSKLIECLATVLGSNKKNVAQLADALTANSQKQHSVLSQQVNQHIQTIIADEHRMKEFYNKEIQNVKKHPAAVDPDLYVSIQSALDDISNEILDTVSHCRSLQEKGENLIEEENLQDMLKDFRQLSHSK